MQPLYSPSSIPSDVEAEEAREDEPEEICALGGGACAANIASVVFTFDSI